jgi:hypothetical protein
VLRPNDVSTAVIRRGAPAPKGLAVRGRGAQAARKTSGCGCRRVEVQRGSRGLCRSPLGVIREGRQIRPEGCSRLGCSRSDWVSGSGRRWPRLPGRRRRKRFGGSGTRHIRRLCGIRDWWTGVMRRLPKIFQSYGRKAQVAERESQDKESGYRPLSKWVLPESVSERISRPNTCGMPAIWRDSVRNARHPRRSELRRHRHANPLLRHRVDP